MRIWSVQLAPVGFASCVVHDPLSGSLKDCILSVFSGLKIGKILVFLNLELFSLFDAGPSELLSIFGQPVCESLISNCSLAKYF